MSYPIDINSASEEVLKSLQGIGNGRARAIVKLREEKGPLQREDLVSMADIPALILNPLLEEGKIAFGTPVSGDCPEGPKPDKIEELLKRVSLLEKENRELRHERQQMSQEMSLERDRCRSELQRQMRELECKQEQTEPDPFWGGQSPEEADEKRSHGFRNLNGVPDSRFFIHKTPGGVYGKGDSVKGGRSAQEQTR